MSTVVAPGPSERVPAQASATSEPAETDPQRQRLTGLDSVRPAVEGGPADLLVLP